MSTESNEQYRADENERCPFCGGKCDPEGWSGTGPGGEGRSGPECEECGSTAESLEAWNRRVIGARNAGSESSNWCEQYRAGFEAWARNNGLDCDYVSGPSGDRYIHAETVLAFDAWTASKREASTEPSAKPLAYALVRNGKVEGVQRTIEAAQAWVNAEIIPLYTAAGALTDDAKDPARLEVFIDWYLREGSRSEVHLYGHMMPTTREIVLQWLDRAVIEAHTKAGSDHA